MGNDDLALELDAAEAGFQLHCLASDIAAGKVPRSAHRGLTPVEEATGINFLAVADDVSRAATDLAQRLGASRARFLVLLEADLRSAGSVDALVARIQAHQALGVASIPGALELLNETSAQLRPILEALLSTAAGRVAAEAASQGVTIPAIATGVVDGQQLERQANRLALRPLADGLLAISEAVIDVPSAATVTEGLDLVAQAGRSLSEAPLTDLASQAASSATGLGRMAAGEYSGIVPRTIYASELLDRNTCGPCSLVDGKEYPTIAAMREDYPAGIYKNCEGGMRCRGVPVIVWSTEVDPTARQR